MSWSPAGYEPEPESGALTAGIYPNCILSDFKQLDADKAAKCNARVVYVATYEDTESGAQATEFIKFGTGRKGGDYHAGLRIERLHAILGAPLGATVNVADLMACADGVTFTVELEETSSNGKTYTNVTDVRASSDVAAPF